MRDSTRATLASTMGAGLLKAKESRAPDVYGPMPGSFFSPSLSEGNVPPNEVTISRAMAWRERTRR